ncbi:CBS domain-containing protein [Blastococcus brunescens]|uniref:CBS domain-containing protein n=1 Tax=Blastococcus brunescens TaxID=1564165 RepID=A0ABZ1B003_9ACTN|nr:CBS domain-containing protein [Blastococcus sp. BMG 8361]WRL64140.1 CBS domain-containing protein [Blastococcus sp. BMG 8361]
MLLGPQGEPTGLVLHDPRTGEVYEAPVSLRVHPTTDVTEALQRALTRVPAVRFDPVLCTDPSGHVLGLIRIEDLASAARKSR